jgi:hypothetical protein
MFSGVSVTLFQTPSLVGPLQQRIVQIGKVVWQIQKLGTNGDSLFQIRVRHIGRVSYNEEKVRFLPFEISLFPLFFDTRMGIHKTS